MTRNLGNADRVIRLLTSMLLVIFFLSGNSPGLPGMLFFIAGTGLFISALFAHCPVYAFIGIRTRKQIRPLSLLGMK
jgi:hypothetical protein